MIALKHKATGAVQFVNSMEGIDTRRWTLVDTDTAGIEAARRVQRAAINRARDAAEQGGVATRWGVFDGDQASRARIAGAVQAAMIHKAQGLPFSVVWTLADNSSVELGPDGMIEAGLAVLARADAVHRLARALKAQIEAAATVAAVQAIIWSEGD